MILVDVYISSLDETFDFRIDETAKVVNVVQEISEMMCKKYKTELNQDAQEFFLCSTEQNIILKGNSTLQDNGITNGCRLFIV